MPGNPMIPQGQLNRVKAAIQFIDAPELNIAASYLGREAIRLALEGEVTALLPALTGNVTSPEPFQTATVTVNLLKSQALGAAFKARIEDSSLLGDFTIFPDLQGGGAAGYTYTITNGVIRNAQPGPFDGADPLWVLTLAGTYIINQSLWN